jgi:hypothetical protein
MKDPTGRQNAAATTESYSVVLPRWNSDLNLKSELIANDLEIQLRYMVTKLFV